LLDPKLREVIRRHLSYLRVDEDLPDDAVLKDLGLDSMRAVDLMFDLEEAFGITMPDEALMPETFGTPATIAAAVRSAQAAG
jgi:acyl carrier protein